MYLILTREVASETVDLKHVKELQIELWGGSYHDVGSGKVRRNHS